MSQGMSNPEKPLAKRVSSCCQGLKPQRGEKWVPDRKTHPRVLNSRSLSARERQRNPGRAPTTGHVKTVAPKTDQGHKSSTSALINLRWRKPSHRAWHRAAGYETPGTTKKTLFSKRKIRVLASLPEPGRLLEHVGQRLFPFLIFLP